MARVHCELCDGYVFTGKGNHIEVDSKHYHRKCIEGEKMSGESAESYKLLRSTVRELCVRHDRPVNWGLIGKQIKDLLMEGFDYDDQLYALEWLYNRDGEIFWGYGRVKKFIYHALEHRKKEEEVDRRMQEIKSVGQSDIKTEIKRPVSRPSFLPR